MRWVTRYTWRKSAASIATQKSFEVLEGRRRGDYQDYRGDTFRAVYTCDLAGSVCAARVPEKVKNRT